MKTIHYKGAIIEITPTTPEYRAKATIFNNIHFWLNVRNARTGNIYDMPVANLIAALRHCRLRILKARTHPRFGW